MRSPGSAVGAARRRGGALRDERVELRGAYVVLEGHESRDRPAVLGHHDLARFADPAQVAAQVVPQLAAETGHRAKARESRCRLTRQWRSPSRAVFGRCSCLGRRLGLERCVGAGPGQRLSTSTARRHACRRPDGLAHAALSKKGAHFKSPENATPHQSGPDTGAGERLFEPAAPGAEGLVWGLQRPRRYRGSGGSTPGALRVVR